MIKKIKDWLWGMSAFTMPISDRKSIIALLQSDRIGHKSLANTNLDISQCVSLVDQEYDFNRLHVIAAGDERKSLALLLPYVPDDMLLQKDIFGRTPLGVALQNRNYETAIEISQAMEKRKLTK